MNEGVLPKGRNEASFLPHDVRRAYGMPLPQDREAIMAYHVYRLVQRAKRVFFLVNGESDGMGKGEASRFIAQMEVELPRYPGIRWEDLGMQQTMDPQRLQRPWKMDKSPDVLNRLRHQLQERGLSPSSMGTFLRDPAEFYLRFVLGVYEEEAVDERMAANIRGSILHHVHETLFKDYQTTGNWRVDLIPSALEAGIQEFHPGRRHSGPFVIEQQVLLKMAEDWAQAEGQRIASGEGRDLPWHIHLVEENIETTLAIGDLSVRMKGKADRIEACNMAGRLSISNPAVFNLLN